MRPALHIVPAAETAEATLRRLFAEQESNAAESRRIAAEIAVARRQWATERGLITPPRIEALKRQVP
jgi:hypothetical protein